LKRIVTALGTAALGLALVLPSAQAANHTTTSSTLFASSLNCQYQEQPDCVNVVLTITQDSNGAGSICVGVADFHATHPPVANGCAELSAAQLFVDQTQVTVLSTAQVPASYTTDCYTAGPEDACVPRSLVLTVSASFVVTGPTESYREAREVRSGSCTTSQSVRGTRANVVGSVTIDGFAYDLSGSDPSLHHFEAWLTRESIRSKTKCGRAGLDDVLPHAGSAAE
jgi:hypothetical protein